MTDESSQDADQRTGIRESSDDPPAVPGDGETSESDEPLSGSEGSDSAESRSTRDGTGTAGPDLDVAEPSGEIIEDLASDAAAPDEESDPSAESSPGEDTGSYDYNSSEELSSELTPGPGAENSKIDSAGEQTPPGESDTLGADSEETGPVDYETEQSEASQEISRERSRPAAEPSNQFASPERRAFQDDMAADLDAEGPDRLDPENMIGVTIDDRYRIEDCIGAGGMAVVYKAHQEALDREIVIKVLPEKLVNDDEAVARFEREARGMSQLEHPHVVSTYDFGHESNVAYICMEYVEGITLAERVSEGALSLQEFCTIAVQILQGIGDAHAMGMVHRDIKPANIMLCERRGFDHYVKLLDFGLAKLLQDTNDVTKEQKLVGSVSFLSPEQIMGKGIDERVDVYSLGVLFYYMLSGEKPFTADEDIRVLYQHVHNSPSLLYNKLPDSTDVPERLVDLIHRCLSKKPENRPESANQLLDEFTAAVPPGLIHLPWSTGEFSSPASSRVDPDSSREPLTPPAEATPSSSREILRDSTGVDREQLSNTATRVDGETLADDDSGIMSNLPLIGGVVLGVGALGIAAVVLTGKDESGEADEVPSETSKAAAAKSKQQENEGEQEGSPDESGASVDRPTVRVKSDPSGRVKIGGESMGSSPVKTTLDPGEHTIEVTADGHESWSKSVDLSEGDERTYRPSLASKEDGKQEDGSKPSAAGSSGTGAAGSSEGARRRERIRRRRERRRRQRAARQESEEPSDSQKEGGSKKESEKKAGEVSASADGSKSEGSEKGSEETASAQETGSSEPEPPTPAEPAGSESPSSSSSSGGSDESESGGGLLPAESGGAESEPSSDDGEGEGGGLLPVDEQ